MVIDPVVAARAVAAKSEPLQVDRDPGGADDDPGSTRAIQISGQERARRYHLAASRDRQAGGAVTRPGSDKREGDKCSGCECGGLAFQHVLLLPKRGCWLQNRV